MRGNIYTYLVEWIEKGSTWIEVYNRCEILPVTINTPDHLAHIASRTLTLRSYLPKGRYKAGHIWHIPETDLNNAVKILRRNNLGFKIRCRNGCITAKDAENIVSVASFGLIRLDLIKDFSALKIPEKASCKDEFQG